MVKKLALVLLFLSSFSLLAISCGQSGNSSNTAGTSKVSSTARSTVVTGTVTVTNTPPTASAVHMNATNFVQQSVTIKVGSSLQLINDSSTTHTISNGSWTNGKAAPQKEPDAPTANVTIKGKATGTVGPFTAPGTYHFYSTDQSGMNLTVIVQ